MNKEKAVTFLRRMRIPFVVFSCFVLCFFWSLDLDDFSRTSVSWFFCGIFLICIGIIAQRRCKNVGIAFELKQILEKEQKLEGLICLTTGAAIIISGLRLLYLFWPKKGQHWMIEDSFPLALIGSILLILIGILNVKTGFSHIPSIMKNEAKLGSNAFITVNCPNCNGANQTEKGKEVKCKFCYSVFTAKEEKNKEIKQQFLKWIGK